MERVRAIPYLPRVKAIPYLPPPPPRSEYVAPFWRVDQNRTSPVNLGDGTGTGEPRKGAELWAKARAVKTNVKLTKRWHKDVDTWYKRLWL